MKLFVVILVLIILEVSAAKDSQENDDTKKTDSRTVYDQRQTGKYNVHVNIKDVQFFSLSDSISSLGDYSSYDYGGDYGDYDESHLTVNPIFAFLGSSSKPTKPSTTTQATTEKLEAAATSKEPSTNVVEESTMTTMKQEAETTVKQENITNAFIFTTEKPALRPLKVNESIDYEEIPVEVQYYRANQPKLPLAHASPSLLHNNHNRHAVNLKRHRRPSVVQILDGRTNNNVKIIESDDQERTVKICGRGEVRDVYGRCRIKASGRNHGNPGLRRIFNVLSSILPKSK